ncbi:MAG: thiamine pyrophosphate-dependent dehydrogenase E1 component subunit alpha [Candidatus Sumerlaeia bacterium]
MSEKYSKEFLLKLYRKMVLIRKFEDRVKFLFLEGIMPGTIHQYQGEEACAVGVCEVLEEQDIITSTHRPHGHALARGLSVQEMMDELFGKATGCCKGKGGSMHMGDLDKGMVPAIAIVGGGVPIATGLGLGYKMRGERGVAVCFMGDGASNEGAFHEGVNMGSIWDLPVLYVIENNLYGASTPVNSVMRTSTIAERGAAYGIPGVTINGNDVLKVYETAKEAAERARDGKGPTLIELLTYRITGHSRRDPAAYQPDDEKKKALENEPIKVFREKLLADNTATTEELDAIDSEIDDEIEVAVEKAQQAPDPKPEDCLEDVFVEAID